MKKKEQFNLALWDRLKKDNIPHTFETRHGSPVTQITKFDVNLDQPIAGVYGESIDSWGIDGNYYTENTKDSDLFIVWEEEQLMLEGWFNVHLNEGLYFYPTKELADEEAIINDRIACVKVSIPYTKGEGLNNPTTN